MGLAAYCEIQLSDLMTKRAENAASGDVFREAVTGGFANVEKVYNSPAVGMFRITGENGCILDLTEDHHVLTATGMLPAGHVKPGDQLLTAFGPVRCSESAPLFGDYMVYDLVVRADGVNAPCLSVGGFVVAALKAR